MHKDGWDLGLSEDGYKDLKKAHHSLLKDDSTKSTGDWLVEYRSKFQSILDDTAKRRIEHYALKVAVGTAAARVSVIDQGIVLYASTALVKDLMFIYGLRPEFSQAAMILALSIRNTYLAGPMQAISEAAVDATVSEIAPKLLETKFAAMISASVLEGMLNRALILRLGQQAVQLLQPVHPPERI